MTPDLFAALDLFAFVASITPGPNNAMLLASGLNFGVRRTLPHMLGISVGFAVMIACVGFGLGALLQTAPRLQLALKVVSILYLVRLAWKIANAAPPSSAPVAAGRPFTFLQAAAFQWVNPKAWALALTAIAAYAPSEDFAFNVAVVALVFGVVNAPSVAVWAVFGSALRRFLGDPRMLRRINVAMALALVVSTLPLVADLFH